MYFLHSQGIIDLDDVQEKMKIKEKQRLLSKHKYRIFYDEKDNRWKTTVPDETKKRGRRLIAKSSRDKLDNFLIDYYKQLEEIELQAQNQIYNKTRDQITLRDIFPHWLDYKSAHTRSSSYIKRIYTDWKTFYLCDEIIDKPIVELTFLYVDKWIHNIIRKNKMTKTKYYNMAIILRQCLDYACEEELGIIKNNPMKRIKIKSNFFTKMPKPSHETQVFLSNEQSILLAETRYRYEHRPYCTTPLAVMFNFQVGLRIGELVALKWSDINGNYLHVQRMEIQTFSIDANKSAITSNGYEIIDYTKSNAGDREVYLNEEARLLLKEIKKCNMKYERYDDDFIFLTSDKGKRANSRTITRYLEKLCASTGITNKSNHKIRKTYISSLFDHGLNIDTIRQQAGHEDERTSLNNYCFDQRTNKEIENQLEAARNNNTAFFSKQSVS